MNSSGHLRGKPSTSFESPRAGPTGVREPPHASRAHPSPSLSLRLRPTNSILTCHDHTFHLPPSAFPLCTVHNHAFSVRAVVVFAPRPFKRLATCLGGSRMDGQDDPLLSRGHC
ncbi:hypothetical protein CIHG_04945 [Coccidioides immitis H538.4]|uniref:Uncharacterized protein n=3 Tax=Coccidioides immitis TaxID=5501 RepID=A0A0J8R707_COCIT|nr:hypothetical protein CIRG_05454 [Coccidioides immitis RMSCC 2394]KMU80814.1 hypothetical protein CISG_08939 [Coccidioides immitis RMSCC 3703]KMU87005.1 hypothetical protein CIHG_04945 [Coccidioides immitis H538.4]